MYSSGAGNLFLLRFFSENHAFGISFLLKNSYLRLIHTHGFLSVWDSDTHSFFHFTWDDMTLGLLLIFFWKFRSTSRVSYVFITSICYNFHVTETQISLTAGMYTYAIFPRDASSYLFIQYNYEKITEHGTWVVFFLSCIMFLFFIWILSCFRILSLCIHSFLKIHFHSLRLSFATLRMRILAVHFVPTEKVAT